MCVLILFECKLYSLADHVPNQGAVLKGEEVEKAYTHTIKVVKKIQI